MKTKVVRTKKCPGPCGRTLPHTWEYFARHKGHGQYGLESRCKDCVNAEERAQRQAIQSAEFPNYKLPGQLEPHHRAMQFQTVEAFEAFYNEFATTDKKIKGLPAHALAWVEAALDNKFLLLNVPPRHAKTTIMAEWFPIWQFACNRNTQIIIVSKTADGAVKKITRKVAYELEFNRKLNHAFGRFRSRNRNAKWSENEGAFLIEGKELSEASGDLSFQVRGSGQAILGMEADWIIADDVTDPRVARSPAERKKEDDWFHEEVLTRLSPHGKVFCIGQRVHGEDLYGRLQELKDEDGTYVWNTQMSPAILDEETQHVLWTEEWPYEILREKRRAMGPSRFNCMYQQSPETSGEFIRKEWIAACLDRERKVGDGLEQGYMPITRVLAVDPSPTQFCAMVVADSVYLPGQTQVALSLVDIKRLGPQVSPREMFGAVQELLETYRPTVCIFEENSVKGWLREDPMWNMLVAAFRKVVYHTTGRNKQDPELGVWSLGTDFELGRIRMPYGDEDSRQTSELLISEALSFPNGRTDDVLMALWFIKSNFRQLIPLEAIATRFNRGLVTSGGSWKGWSR